MSKKVYVTGLGTISAIGWSVAEMLVALQTQRSGMGGIQRFDTGLPHIPVCEVQQDNSDLLKMLPRYVDKSKDYSRTCLLGMMAACEAMQGSHSAVPADRISIVGATTVAGMDYNEQYYKELEQGKVNPYWVELLDCADATQQIAAAMGIFANVTTVSTACSSSANAIIAGARMIRTGLADKVLVGGADALTRFTMNGFNTLQILSPTGCKPFDAHRNGVTLGEGAAYLLLESEATALSDDIQCELSGYGSTSDAYHQTSSSPDGAGAVMAIRKALSTAGLAPEDIDYINAHGTGTEVNDLSEGRAVETVFGAKIPPISSTKGYTGHTLAAAGAIEAVISSLSLREKLLFPNIGFENAMPELSFIPNTQLRSADIRHVMSNSFGFGGNNVSLIFSSC
ncbi:MAG: beta-ketoacyl-[acyl-carrier-protein] synthase family protein [Bacteroidales bacterium]|jgi:3-oxoacyl-[acyl-carrier-protein] synthase-1|nr:beta-ketoacyl-[acyl-carrier-protein] synthase family protein [Bacteroidales bacterium]